MNQDPRLPLRSPDSAHRGVPASSHSEGEGPSPTREELQAELLDVPEDLPEDQKSVETPGVEHVLAAALRYVRGKRGGDLLAVLLVGSGVRRALTPHSDLDLIALVKGQDEGDEVIRVAERYVDIRYRSHKAVEQELSSAPRLPPLLRKGRVVFEHEAFGTRIIEKANHRFRQGPPPADLNEKIRLKVETLHWLGKASDLLHQPATAEYLLGSFVESLLQGFFRLRSYWLTAPADMLRFVSSRDSTVGELLDRFMTTASLPDRIAVGRQLVDVVFKDIPTPPRVD
jgi:predicted nucleotidyltransferase